MSLLSDIDDQLNILRPLADKASGEEAIFLNEQIIKLLEEKDTLLGAGAKYADGGAVRPNNPLNRKMFQQPIKAQQGVYVPTIEQIMNFYQGGFDQGGQPTDTESFLRAIEATKLMNEKGFFPGEGDPLKFLFYPDNKKGIMEIAEQFNFPNITSAGFGQPGPEGDAYLALINEIAAKDQAERDAGDAALIASGVPQEIDPDVGRKAVARDLIEAGIGNLSGTPTGQPATRDENIEMIKRNILQGTNIVEPGTPEYESLSAVDKMKIDDAISQQKREEVDLTEVSKNRVKNFITAAGDSTEAAIMIYNDMLNAGGRIAEAADEVLEGWKEAFSEGFSADQKKSLNEQIEFLKEKGPNVDLDKLGAPIFGIDMETLEKGGENIKNWYKETVLPEIVEGGVDIVQSVFGAQDLGDGTLSEEQLKIGTPAITADPRLASGISESQDKAIDLADRVPNDVMANVAERIGPFETKIKDGKELVTDGLNQVKKIAENLKEVAPDAYEVVEKEIKDLQQKIKNNEINTKDFNKKLTTVKDNFVELTQNLGGEVKENVVEVFDNIKDATANLMKVKPKSRQGPLDEPPMTEEELAKFRVKTADGSDVSVEDSEAVTGTLDSKDEVDAIEKGANQVVDGSSVKEGDGKVLSSAAATTGEPGSQNMNDLITQTLKESGYNLDTVKDPDMDALKMIYYGTLIATTPGEFKDAAMQTLNRFVTDEINTKYRTAAQKQKFKGEVFKVLLAGKLDILKEEIKAGKGVNLKAGFLPGAKDQTSMVQSVMVNKFGIDVDIDDDDATSPTNDFINAVKSKAATYMTEARTANQNINYEDAVSRAVDELIPMFTTEEVDNEGLLRKTGKILTPKFAEDFLFGKDPDRTMKITGRLEGDDIVQQVIAAVKQQKGITITEDQARKLIQDFEKSKT